MTVFLIEDGGKVWIRKRPKEGLLAGLYEFPNQPGHLTKKQVADYVEAHGFDPIRVEKLEDAKHIFSHVEWHMKGYRVRVAAIDERRKIILWTWMKCEERMHFHRHFKSLEIFWCKT